MKIFALLVTLVLVALAVPVSAMIPQPIPYCHVVQGTSCTSVGAKKSCTDVCGNNLSCTCTYYYSNPGVRFWNCQQEC